MSTLQTVVLGDKAVQVEAADVAAIEAFKTASAKALTDAQTAATDAKAEHDKAMAAKDAEIEALQAKVLDDAALDKRVATRAKLVADAKAIAPDVKTAGLSDADIRKAVVTDKLGEAAVAGRSDAYLDARFDILVETADADAGKPDAFRDAAMTRDAKTALTDAEKARETYLDGFRTNHVKTEA